MHVSSCLCIHVCTQLVVGVGVCVRARAGTHTFASGQELLCGIATGEVWSIKLVSIKHPLGLAFISSKA